MSIQITLRLTNFNTSENQDNNFEGLWMALGFSRDEASNKDLNVCQLNYTGSGNDTFICLDMHGDLSNNTDP